MYFLDMPSNMCLEDYSSQQMGLDWRPTSMVTLNLDLLSLWGLGAQHYSFEISKLLSDEGTIIFRHLKGILIILTAGVTRRMWRNKQGKLFSLSWIKLKYVDVYDD